MAVYATDFAVDAKADNSPVSEADRRAEAAIAERLWASLPDVPVVAEEASAAGRRPAIGNRFLLVDPLDGTKEFVSRNGEFTVNVALIENGAPVAGMVLAPVPRLAYAASSDTAWKGTLDASMRQVSDWRRISVALPRGKPIAVASRSHSTLPTEEALRMASCGERRAIGSSLKFCIVAEGEADFYPRLGPTMEWDTAAGDAVLRAAGGHVVTLDGEPLSYGKIDVAGMRDFENPSFLAAGDGELLKRLDLVRLRASKAA
jgi:3'(2'),5'-bisphosphate nucleotidase